MRPLILLLVNLAPVLLQAGPFEACQKENPTWFRCTQDSDCVVISNPCGHPTAAAHKKFSAKAEQCNIQKGAALGCVSWETMGGGKTQAVCRNKVCTTKPVQPEN